MSIKKKVLVGMSGGIDSSAVCILLQQQGYEVVGLTMRVWDLPRQFSEEGQTLPDFIRSAKELAERLGIEHIVADEREDFKKIVVQNFLEEYKAGRTPNPCVLCNKYFKFRVLTHYADRLGCAFIATGHYVRLVEEEGYTFIAQGVDRIKDQSYFLWRLGQDVLHRCLFPLGTRTKPEVRDFLDHEGFAVKARSSESMEICFVENDYRDFLRQQLPQLDHEVGHGWFVNKEGKKLGEHQGAPFYTIGQRKGLGIALGQPAYVIRINAEKNTIMLGDENQLSAQDMIVEDLNAANEQTLETRTDLTVRIRYHSALVPCTLRRLEENKWLVHFSAPLSAVTPGQSAVFYVGDRVVAGALIASQRGIAMYL